MSRVGPYYRFRCSRRTFDRVSHLAVEGVSRASIARVEGSGWNTIDRWLNRAAEYAQRFNHEKTRGIELIELQADEIRTFAQRKAWPTWIFTSMEVCSRFWVSTVVGRRSYRNTHTLLNDTLARGIIAGIPLIATDGFKFYAQVVGQLFGTACIYGQVVKTWRKDRTPGSSQRFLSIHAVLYNHFNTRRHLVPANEHRALRSEAFKAWDEVVGAAT